MLHGAQKGSAVPLILPPHFMAIRHCAVTCATPAVFPGGIPAPVSFGGAGLCFTEQRFINGSFLSAFMLFYALSFAFRSISPSPTGLFLLQMRLLRKSPGRAGQKNCTERPLPFSLASTTIKNSVWRFCVNPVAETPHAFFVNARKLHQQIVRQKCVSPGFTDQRISYVLKERKME